MSAKALLTLLLVLQSAVLPLACADTERHANHALLIGIEDYSGTKLPSLDGPRNDIDLVSGLLKQHFHVEGVNITTLVDADATHTGIQNGFAQLAERVRPGDFVYIHYSGHGSYTDDKNGDEPSGKDQTWVSYGSRAGRFHGQDDHDVLDDEINQWLGPLYKKTHRIVFISDSCHSASMSRGPLKGVRAAVADPRPHPLAGKQFDQPKLQGVRVGSARDTENAIEIEVEGKAYGLFTWFWVEALSEARPGESWDEVFRRAYTLVTTQRGAYQRPQLEGEANYAIFGGDFVAPQRTVAVRQINIETGSVTIETGAVNGATEGSVYRRHGRGSPAEDAATPTLEIARVKAFSSDGKVQQGGFRVGDLVVETTHAYPFDPLKLAVEGDYTDAQDSSLKQRITSTLQKLDGFKVVATRADADWVIYVLRPKRESGRYVYAVARSTLPVSDPEQTPEAWVVNRQEELVNDKLRHSLKPAEEGIRALTENLKKLARVNEIKRLQSRTGAPAISVTTFLYRPSDDCAQDCVNLPDAAGNERPYRRLGSHSLSGLSGMEPKLDDLLTFSVTNEDSQDYYVYLLDIAPDGGIHAIFPLPQHIAEHARIKAGNTRDLGDDTVLLLNALGLETVKVIASAEPLDVRLLESESYTTFERTRGANATLLSPLERLLAEAMFTRGKPVSMAAQRWGTLMAEFTVRGTPSSK